MSELNFIYNWENNVKKTNDGLKYMAVKTASELKDRGFSSSEALELLVSDKYDLKIAEKSVNEVYSDNQDIKKASLKVPVIPTSYDDVKHIVEYKIKNLGAKEFLSILCDSKRPLVKLSSKRLSSLESVIKTASEQERMFADVHQELRPWVENALVDSVLLSEKLNGELKTINEAKGVYEIKTASNSITVDLINGTSTSKRFTEGKFGELCIPDEYLIFASEKVLPHGRILRDLNI